MYGLGSMLGMYVSVFVRVYRLKFYAMNTILKYLLAVVMILYLQVTAISGST